MNYAHLNEVYDDYLEHYGVKGMKWGKDKLKARLISMSKTTDFEYDRAREKMNGKYSPKTYQYKTPSGYKMEITPTGTGYSIKNQSGTYEVAGTVDEIRGLSDKDKKDIRQRRARVVASAEMQRSMRKAAVKTIDTGKRTAAAFNKGSNFLKSLAQRKKKS